MTNAIINIQGLLLGRRVIKNRVVLEVVHIQNRHPGGGPAENAFVLVEHHGDGKLARYISWINYHDLEYARSVESGWEIIEPGSDFKAPVSWQQYGYEGNIPIPSLGYRQ